MIDLELEAYGCDYVPEQVAGPADATVRSGDRYVAARDLLRARAIAESGAEADVQLGVDPGTFYCGHQLATLLALRERSSAPAVGFIHVPPDRETGPAAAGAAHLHGRADTLEQCARVVAVALRGMTEGTGPAAVLLTGFGPFLGVADNPTEAFVAGAEHRARALRLAFPGGAPIEVIPAVLPLAASRAAALAGDYFAPDLVADAFLKLLEETGPVAAVLSLGVDSGQVRRAARPAFRVETQTRGFHGPQGRGRTATDAFRRDLGLARVFMAARAGGDSILRYER